MIKYSTTTSLKFDRICEKAASFSKTESARAAILNPVFYSSLDEVTRETALTAEIAGLIAEGDRPPFEEIPKSIDSAIFTRAERGGVLSPEELVLIGRAMRGAAHLKYFFSTRRDRLSGCFKIAARLSDLKSLYNQIINTFDEDLNIKDSASFNLSSLRESLKKCMAQIRNEIEIFLRDPAKAELLTDNYFTLRGERYVFPVKSSHYGYIGGVIHGTSNSGATLFVEPEFLVKENNKLKILRDRIAEEELKILRDLSCEVAALLHEIRNNLEAVERLDLIAARAELSSQLKGNLPIFTEKKGFKLLNAANPILLMKGVDVVRNDIILEEGRRFLVISGPNAGGKSVTISTIGLTMLLCYCGMLPPVDGNSVIPLFENIETVIGDLQDVESDLSTFSGQIKRVIEILSADPKESLLLIDELIVGTEPKRGAALAAAVVEEFAGRGFTGVITTHFDFVKDLAVKDERFAAASVGFDSIQCRPTYRLYYGRSGSSNPFEVAAATGLDPAIIERARGFIDRKELTLESLIADYQAKNEELKKMIEEAERERAAHLAEKRNYEELLFKLRKKADRLVYEARRETLSEIRRLKEELRTMVDEFKKKVNLEGAVVRRRRLAKAEEKIIKEMKTEEELIEEVRLERIPPEKIVKGTRVFVKSLSVEGVIGDAISEDEVLVHSGIIKLKVKKSDLFKPAQAKDADEHAQRRESSKVVLDSLKTAQEKPEPVGFRNILDLRGLRLDEALAELERTLDHAYLNDEKEIMIIHGHGTSSLKKGVRDYLAKSPYAASFRPGTLEEGGDGITVAILK